MSGESLYNAKCIRNFLGDGMMEKIQFMRRGNFLQIHSVPRPWSEVSEEDRL